MPATPANHLGVGVGGFHPDHHIHRVLEYIMFEQLLDTAISVCYWAIPLMFAHYSIKEWLQHRHTEPAIATRPVLALPPAPVQPTPAEVALDYWTAESARLMTPPRPVLALPPAREPKPANPTPTAYAELGIRELRRMAKEAGIKGAVRMTKAACLEALAG